MSSNRPSLRVATPSDIPGLVRLFGRTYTQYKPASYFQWQFFSREMPATLVIAHDGNDVVGSFGLMRRFLSGGFYAAQAMDMLLDEAFRGRGLFSEMVEMAIPLVPGVDFLMVLANLAGRTAVVQQLGWSEVARIPVYIASDLNGVEPSCKPNAERTQVESAPLQIIYPETTESWRFSAHPFHRYHLLEVGGVRGYLKIFNDSTRTGKCLGDILYVTEDRHEKLDAWLKKAFMWFYQKNAETCSLWTLPHRPLAESALRVGFKKRVQERWLCVSTVNAALPSNVQNACWNVCEADAEFY